MTAPNKEYFTMTPDTVQSWHVALPTVSLHATVSKVSHILAMCFAYFRPRRTLSMLNDHALRDIGLTRADVDREAIQTLWYL
jgi:uncharacterized protein YjiS (DUF1127 family)